MTTEAIKSTSITNLDALPPIRGVAGQGGGGIMVTVEDHVSPTNGATAPSTYQLIRLPTKAILKKLEIWLEAASTTLTGDIDLYYSDSTTDLTPVSDQGTVAANQLFGAGVALAAVVAPLDLMTAAGTAGVTVFKADTFNQPLWQAAGLTADPGGMFDIVLKTTATNAGTAALHMRAIYVVAGN